MLEYLRLHIQLHNSNDRIYLTEKQQNYLLVLRFLIVECITVLFPLCFYRLSSIKMVIIQYCVVMRTAVILRQR